MRYTSELITVTYSGDLATLYYHALSLEKFWTGEKQWTVIVEDKVAPERVVKWIESYILPAMANWKVNIVIPPILIATDGWHRQQILKLWAASECQSDYCVILDSKNVLVRNLNIDNFFDNNKLKVGVFRNKQSEPDPTHIEACRLLGVDSASEVHPITPFVWRTSIVRDLLLKLKTVNYDVMIQPVINASEAALYWVFAQDKEPWIDAEETWAFGQYGGLTKNTRLNAEQLREQLDLADKNNAFMITMHRFHLTPENADIFSEYLRTKGLVGDWKIAFFRDTFKECLYRIRTEVIDILYNEWGLPPLKTIQRNGQLVKFNRIIAYGCSHTAGSELVDHLYWHEPITAVELDKIKRKYTATHKNNLFYNLYPALGYAEVKEAQAKVSWAGQIAQRFGVPIINRGLPGSSMQGIVYSIEQDLTDGVIGDNDLILIGATSMDRWFHFRNYDENGWPATATPIIGWPDRWPTAQFHNDFVEHVADDYFVMFNYQNAMRFFELLNDRTNGHVCVQFLHSTVDDYISFVKNKNLNKRFLAMFEGINDYRCVIDNKLSFTNLVSWNDESSVHGFYHPHVKYHEQLADIIMNKLLNNE